MTKSRAGEGLRKRPVSISNDGHHDGAADRLETKLVPRCIQMIQCYAPVLAFPAKAVTRKAAGHSSISAMGTGSLFLARGRLCRCDRIFD